MKPVLINFLRRLDKTFAKIHKNQRIYVSTDWAAVASILRGLYQTVWKYPHIMVSMQNFKNLVTTCQYLIIGQSNLLPSLLNIRDCLQARTPRRCRPASPGSVRCPPGSSVTWSSSSSPCRSSPWARPTAWSRGSSCQTTTPPAAWPAVSRRRERSHFSTFFSHFYYWSEVAER